MALRVTVTFAPYGRAPRAIEVCADDCDPDLAGIHKEPGFLELLAQRE